MKMDYNAIQISHVCIEISCALHMFPKNRELQRLAEKIEPIVEETLRRASHEMDLEDFRIEDYVR